MNRCVHPPDVTTLHYKMDGWLGDVLVQSFPCFIATVEAIRKLQDMTATGMEVRDVYISKSDQFTEIYPNRILPDFRWLKITGQAGVEDFGSAKDFRLVVSHRVLNALKSLGMSNALIEDFER